MITRFLASGFYAGYLPYMPGTWGSLVGVLLTWPLMSCSWDIFLIVTIFTFLLGWFLSQKLVQENPQDTDPSYIVIDEIAGLFLTYCIIIWFFRELSFLALGIGFATFRLFDIWKPFPIGWVDKNLSQFPPMVGLSVMLDDILAALPAAGLTILILFL
jgi:phosphatidylglycerophosphatase A